MLLVVDVGNTQTVIGLMDAGALAGDWRIATVRHRTADEMAGLLQGFFSLLGLRLRETVDEVAVASVVPRLTAQLGVNPHMLASAINVSGHLVDVSPLSTIGALCLASAPPGEETALFNKLLAWGLSMTVVGAIFCYVFFSGG